MIEFGKYDRKVTFQNYQNISDGYGGSTPTFTDVITTFASVMQTKSSSGVSNGQLDLDKLYLVKIQYRALFTPDLSHSIVYNGDRLAIVSVQLNDERQKKEYWITAKK